MGIQKVWPDQGIINCGNTLLFIDGLTNDQVITLVQNLTRWKGGNAA